MEKNQLWYSQHWLLLSVHRRDTRARVTRARGGGAVCGPCRPLIKTSVLMSIRRDQKMFTVATRTRQSAHINHTPINQVNRGARFWAFVLKEIIEHIKIKAKVKNWFICQSLKCELLHLSWIGSHPPGRHDITGTCRLNIPDRPTQVKRHQISRDEWTSEMTRDINTTHCCVMADASVYRGITLSDGTRQRLNIYIHLWHLSCVLQNHAHV